MLQHIVLVGASILAFIIGCSIAFVVAEEYINWKRKRILRRIRDEDIARETEARARASRSMKDQKIIDTAQEFNRDQSA